MKKLIAATIVSLCFLGSLTAQPLRVVDASKQSGEDAWVRGKPHHYVVNYKVTLSCDNLNSLVLDSIYIQNLQAKLIANTNFTIDSLHHPWLICIYSNPANAYPLQRKIASAGLIIYEYKGIKYTLPLETIKHQYIK